jgi:hypothetical protein
MRESSGKLMGAGDNISNQGRALNSFLSIREGRKVTIPRWRMLKYE